MSAADERLAGLLNRWGASVDLHARYLALDDAAYAKVQDWPKHQRPNRWVLELARTRLAELQRLTDERRSRGDTGFAEALELMAFLTSLLGSEHVDRFIPLARPPSTPPQEAPGNGRRRARRQATAAMKPAASAKPAAARKSAPVVDEPTVGDRESAMVIADAVRLISWGREWPQLAGLIARLANRPPEAEVWTILRKHRAAIEAQARRPPD